MKRTILLFIGYLICVLNTSYGLAADFNKGREVYAINCQFCHGADGRGVVADTPNFTFGDSLIQPDIVLFNSISSGKGMSPAFRGVLSEEEIFDVISYLRTLQR
jgi:mono/diheme cytochrome c family protein